jgi:hypothetical protein
MFWKKNFTLTYSWLKKLKDEKRLVVQAAAQTQ